MTRAFKILALTLVAAFSGVGAVAVHFTAHPTAKSVSREYDDHVVYLDQAWSKADRDTFYWISQGTVMMSYDIFQNLELANSQELFRSDTNMERYGLIPSPPDPQGNPDGLPIGVTKQVITEGRWKGTEAGFNCAACHVSELHYKGKRIRIDGNAGVHIDIQALFHCADDAMQATLHDSAKFVLYRTYHHGDSPQLPT
jgi:hypothetical protein